MSTRDAIFPPGSPFHWTSHEQAAAAALITSQQTLGAIRDRHNFGEHKTAAKHAEDLAEQVTDLIAALRAMPDEDGAA